MEQEGSPLNDRLAPTSSATLQLRGLPITAPTEFGLTAATKKPNLTAGLLDCTPRKFILRRSVRASCPSVDAAVYQVPPEEVSSSRMDRWDFYRRPEFGVDRRHIQL
jgi:hypothetical protein